MLGSSQLGAPSLLPGRVAGPRLSDRVGDEVVLVALEARQRVNDRMLDRQL